MDCADYVARCIDFTHLLLICTIMKLYIDMVGGLDFSHNPPLFHMMRLWSYLEVVIKQNVNGRFSLHICLHGVVDANIRTCSIFHSDVESFSIVRLSFRANWICFYEQIISL